MLKKKLCTPLSTYMRRYSTTIHGYCPKTSPLSQIKYSNYILPSPPLPQFHDRLLHLHTLRFSRKFLFSNSTEKLESRCWNCHAVPESAPFLFCQSCRSIQPMDNSVDYFEIFGLEKKYDIEDNNLESKYKDWQKKLHPDLVHSKSEKERDFAAEQSARVIDAYRTLRKPLLRGIYMMKLEGVEVDEEQTVSDPELLSEIMEIREAVEEAADSEALNNILSQMEKKVKRWANAFANALQSRNFEEAKTSIQRMTYYDRVIDEVVKKL